MKLILLRHEERDLSNPLFFTPLTNRGMERRYQLVNSLLNQNIDEIYVSPFLRTIQTVMPFADELGKKLKIEYGLYEYIHNPKFYDKNWYHSVDELVERHPEVDKYIDLGYDTKVVKSDFQILEDERSLERRIRKFMKTFEGKEGTILLVSHMGVINKIKDMYVSRTRMNDYFGMGHFEVYYM
jgi:broad specificity phosphatase PhoE